MALEVLYSLVFTLLACWVKRTNTDAAARAQVAAAQRRCELAVLAHVLQVCVFPPPPFFGGSEVPVFFGGGAVCLRSSVGACVRRLVRACVSVDVGLRVGWGVGVRHTRRF